MTAIEQWVVRRRTAELYRAAVAPSLLTGFLAIIAFNYCNETAFADDLSCTLDHRHFGFNVNSTRWRNNSHTHAQSTPPMPTRLD